MVCKTRESTILKFFQIDNRGGNPPARALGTITKGERRYHKAKLSSFGTWKNPNFSPFAYSISVMNPTHSFS